MSDDIEPIPLSFGHRPLRAPARVSLFNLLVGLAGIGLGLAGGLMLRGRFPVFFGPTRQHVRVMVCQARLTSMGAAMENYSRRHGHYPRSQYELVPDFLAELPRCPAAGRVTYRTSLTVPKPDGKRGYRIECCGTNHRDALLAPNFPAYESERGLEVQLSWR